METIAGIGCRSYISEPNRGKRRWAGKEEARDATYNNRSRMRSDKGKALMRRRGELIERSFAHTMESGAMRRAHLRGHENIMKRYHLHTAAFNLGLVMRSLVGAGTPKGLHEKRRGLLSRACDSIAAMIASFIGFSRPSQMTAAFFSLFMPSWFIALILSESSREATSSTAC
ncbi:MAG: transposase [Planctomycetota bacterium]|jgi:transposase